MRNKKSLPFMRSLPENSFLRHVLSIITGSVLSQAISIIVSPLLTSLYSPSEIGNYSVYVSILSVLTVVSCLQFDPVIVLPEADEDAYNVFTVALIACALVTLLCLVVVVPFRHALADLFNAPSLSTWLLLLPLSVLLAGLYQALRYWNTRQKAFSLLSQNGVLLSGVTSATQVGLGLTRGFSGGMIVGSLLGHVASTLFLSVHFLRTEFRALRQAARKDRIRSMVIRYYRFPLYSSWSVLFNSLSTSLPNLLLSLFFDTSVTGFYALGYRVLSLPISVIGGAVAQVFYPAACQAVRRKVVSDYARDMLSWLLRVIIVPILLIMICAPHLFSLIFGAQWYMAGIYVQYLSPWILLSFVYSPLSILFNALERQKHFLVLNIVTVVLRFLALIIGGLSGNPLLAVALYGIAGVIIALASSLFVLHIAGVRTSQSLGVFVKRIVSALPYLAVPFASLFLTDNSLIITGLSILVGIVFLLVEGKPLVKSLNAFSFPDQADDTPEP